MIFISYLILVLVIIVDLLFYIPIYIHFYIDEKDLYFYIYSIAIIRLDSKKHINMLANKISISKIVNSKKENLSLIEVFNIERILININKKLAIKYSYFTYPFLFVNNLNNIEYKITDKTKVYVKVKLLFVNYISKLIKIRKVKKI